MKGDSLAYGTVKEGRPRESASSLTGRGVPARKRGRRADGEMLSVGNLLSEAAL